MDNYTPCPHCLTALQKHDTTCWQCGEEVDLTEPENSNEEESAIVKLVWLIAVAVIGGLFVALVKGSCDV